jgi:hypothetical protein
MRDFDSGQPIDKQIEFQWNLDDSLQGFWKAIDLLARIKRGFDKILMSGCMDDFGYTAVQFDAGPEIVCSGGSCFEYDFEGRHLQDIDRLPAELEWTALTLSRTSQDALFSIGWPEPGSVSRNLAQSLNEVEDNGLAEVLVRFALTYIDTLAFSPDWWEGLSEQAQQRIIEISDHGRRLNLFAPNSCDASGPPLVTWKPLVRISSLVRSDYQC